VISIAVFLLIGMLILLFAVHDPTKPARKAEKAAAAD